MRKIRHLHHQWFFTAAVLLLAVAVLIQSWSDLESDPRTTLGQVNQAYIGPGAGIALVGSFLVILAAIASAIVTILTWPARRLWRALRGQRALRDAKVKRVVVLGLDGLEPTLTDQFLKEGLLPNLAGLAESGGYMRLGTTWPPLSPVAWSSFSTGTNPGKHNIYDFISRNPLTYLPTMSSVQIGPPRRQLKVGRFVIPLSRPELTGLRKSKPVWSVLGDAGVFSAVLRVPITFPPDRFNGVQLSAMCVPDLLGTQGTFFHYGECGDSGRTTDGDVGGERILVERRGNVVHSYLQGPENPLRQDRSVLKIPFTVCPNGNHSTAVLRIAGQRIPLFENEFSDWIRFSFKAAFGVSIRGVTRFYLKQFRDVFEMYSTPLQIDPDKPVMPIAHPLYYSSYLARQQGTFATLGLAEDTWSLSEGMMSEDSFLQQAYDIHEERVTMFFDALKKVRGGLVVCVFDAPDRIQHMFWRFLDDEHPAMCQRENTHPDSIREMYVRMDGLVGETLERIDEDTLLFVMSDHGFKPFRRGVDLNFWLLENGYLKLIDDANQSDNKYLKDVDWSQTRAYAVGLAGIYVNQRGREAQGIVDGGDEKRKLVEELTEQLTGLVDTKTGQVAIHEAVASGDVYGGPYVEAAPDVIVGYNVGFRVSWESAVGKTSGQVFSDNQKAWSGDHCVHPQLVPGVLFSSMSMDKQDASITDLAPTILDLLGVPQPSYMDGRSLLSDNGAS